jgi:hypothetical protein
MVGCCFFVVLAVCCAMEKEKKRNVDRLFVFVLFSEE